MTKLLAFSRALAWGILILGFTACASQKKPQAAATDDSLQASLGLYEIDKPTPSTPDPFEGFNRAMYQVNDVLYENALKPIAVLYSRVIPQPIRKNVSNAYSNIGYPGRAVNSLLQGRWDKFEYETEKFIINSTIGIAGFFKPSDSMLEEKFSPEDVNQTLASWGFGDGFYLYLPIFGPTTTRGAVGQVGDRFLYPFTYLGNDDWRLGLMIERGVNDLSLRYQDFDSLKESAIDPYTALKDAYLQHTENLISK